MSVNPIDGLPRTGDSSSEPSGANKAGKTGTDGVRQIEQRDSHKLLPLPEAIHSEQTVYDLGANVATKSGFGKSKQSSLMGSQASESDKKEREGNGTNGGYSPAQ